MGEQQSLEELVLVQSSVSPGSGPCAYRWTRLVQKAGYLCRCLGSSYSDVCVRSLQQISDRTLCLLVRITFEEGWVAYRT